jgi:uncharacterized protein (TIGR00255 family)
MFRSMTGFGSFEANDEICAQFWEIRSVNGKQLSLRFKVPGFLGAYEPDWERLVRRYAQRGRIDVSLQLKLFRREEMPLSLNEPLAAHMLDQLQSLARKRDQAFEPDYNRLLSLANLWQEAGTQPHGELGDRLTQGLEAALADWNEARAREGRALKSDLGERLQRMQGWLEDLGRKTNGLAEERLESLRERAAKLLEGFESAPSEDRMLQELALLADKLDVSEELTRLETHLRTLRGHLQQEDSGGRGLDFLMQECFREINTCGNKAQNPEVSRLVVSFKSELEKCREQIQNVE